MMLEKIHECVIFFQKSIKEKGSNYDWNEGSGGKDEDGSTKACGLILRTER